MGAFGVACRQFKESGAGRQTNSHVGSHIKSSRRDRNLLGIILWSIGNEGGEIVATDNGDATSVENFQAPEHNAYNGLALAIVRAKAGQPGKFTVKAEADGLEPATIRVEGRQRVAWNGRAETDGARTALSASCQYWGRNTRTRLSALR
jgi:hypothetical protein